MRDRIHVPLRAGFDTDAEYQEARQKWHASLGHDCAPPSVEPAPDDHAAILRGYLDRLRDYGVLLARQEPDMRAHLEALIAEREER